jgi:L-fuculose-phosphate aldolase
MFEKEKKILKKYARLAGKLGLVWGMSGNMSLRIDQTRFLITSSKAELRELKGEEIVTYDINTGIIEGIKPSMELKMHTRIYKARDDVMAILHAQPLFSTILACIEGIEIKTEIIPESIVYLSNIARIPYQHPGSIELSEEIEKKIRQTNVLLLQNHGVVCVGKSIKEVIIRAQTLEFLAKIIIIAQAGNIHLSYISKHQVDELLNIVKY